MNLKPEYLDDGTNFFKIDPLFIDPDDLTQFSLYEKKSENSNQFRFRCLLMDTSTITKQRLMELLKSWENIYINKQQINCYNTYLKNNLAHILKHEDINVSRKTGLLKDISMEVVKQTFETNFEYIKEKKGALKNIEILVSQSLSFISDIKSLNGIAELIGHDYDTHVHSIKVAWLMAVFINANLDLFTIQSNEQRRYLLTDAAVAGMLHDIGKVKIPKNILQKKGKLDNLEYLLIQSHSAYSTILLFNSGLSDHAMEAILYHHENEDGSGYPCNLSRDNIPMLAKICHIADVFDALTSKRHYKAAKSPLEALKIMTGQNPFLESLLQFEKEARENIKTPVTTHVRDDYEARLRRLREKEILEAESRKRVEARMKIRDKGMAHCFNTELLKRFILTLNRSESFQLSQLL